MLDPGAHPKLGLQLQLEQKGRWKLIDYYLTSARAQNLRLEQGEEGKRKKDKYMILLYYIII
jgi:hypothetical protein